MNQTQAQQLVGTLLRVVLGIVFIVHGLAKLQMGLENVSGWFNSMGIPGFTAYFIAYLELIGGILMIFGLGTRYIALLFAATMLVAIVKVKLAAGFTGNANAGGYEYELVLLALSAYFAAMPWVGYSIDAILRKKVLEAEM